MIFSPKAVVLATAALTVPVMILGATPASAVSASRSRAIAFSSGASGIASSPRSMATWTSRGISVRVPSSVTVYNKAKARIVPVVHRGSGVTKALARGVITVYSGKRRVASGHSVRLRAGSYTESVAVRYHSYKYVTKTKQVAVTTLHPGGTPTGTQCTITAVTSSFGSSVTDVIESTLPRKRPLDIRETPEFLAIAARVRDGLRAGHSYED